MEGNPHFLLPGSCRYCGMHLIHHIISMSYLLYSESALKLNTTLLV